MNFKVFTFMKSPWAYFFATFMITWSLCGILIFGNINDYPALSFGLLILAMMGPGITGILFTHLTRSKEEIRDYWKRVVDVKRITLGWLAIVISLPFLLQILAGIIDALSGGTGLRWGETATEFISNPANQLLGLFIISLVPFFEELGWRGYAQDLLQKKYNAVTASLILGGVWSLWHLPASFIPGTYQAGLGINTLDFWLHFSGIVFLSVAVSWIYINTKRSILVMVIFHAMVNLAGELIKLSGGGETIYTVCWLSLAVAILFGFGKEMLVNPEKVQNSRSNHGAFLSLILISLVSTLFIIQSVSAKSKTLHSRFQTELENICHEYDLPGATAAYVLRDGGGQDVAAGMADKEHQIAMTPWSRMLAASIGKTFVAATALALTREGRLNLDANITEWLGDRPWLPRLPNHDAITLRHLLNHTAGLPNHVESDAFRQAFAENWRAGDNLFSPEDLVAFILDQPPLFKPGEGWYYSDTGYILVGLIIEAATGRSYYDEVNMRFLEPLNLTFTAPSNRRELPGLAAGYLAPENTFDLPQKTISKPGVMAWHPGVEWTGGGLISNSMDLAKWAKALFEGRAMPGKYPETLLRSIPISGEHPDIQYGIGVAIHENGPFGPTYGHGGWIPGYCSSLRYYPDYGVAIAFQINTDIGIKDSPKPVIEKIELRLATVVMAGFTK